MFPDEMSSVCTAFEGLSTGGGNPSYEFIVTGDFNSQLQGMTFAMAHELGHGLNMLHAQSIEADGSISEYGDHSCVMSDIWTLVHLHVPHLIQMGWISLTKLQQVSSSGTYVINPAEDPNSQIAALQIITPDSGGNIYVSYRQPDANDAGFDADLPSGFLTGVSIQYWDGNWNKTQLATKTLGGALSDNQSYTTPNGAVTIKQLSHNGAGATVQVISHVAPSPTAPSVLTAVFQVESVSAKHRSPGIPDAAVLLNWAASTELGGQVAGYAVFKNNQRLDTATQTSFVDRDGNTLKPATYYVQSFDTAGVFSAPSAKVVPSIGTGVNE